MEVAGTEDVQDGRGLAVFAHGQRIALFRRGDAYYALGPRCPHAGGPLEEGYLKGETVICPWHASVFKLDSGEAVGGPALQGVPAYPVKVVAGKVLVGPPPPGTEPPAPSLF
ncbi:MAG: Rieske (2Fe-2S) protein [Actinomycetota bacterium]